MIDVTPLKGKTVAGMGLGRSGFASARALTLSGARVLTWDDDAEARAAAEAASLVISDLRRADFGEVTALVLSSGIPDRHPDPHPVAARLPRGVEPAYDGLIIESDA